MNKKHDKEIREFNQKIDMLNNQSSKRINKVNNLEISPFNIALEILAAIIIGLFIGIFLDKKLNSAPLCLILCIMLGFVASLKNIWLKWRNK